MAPGSEKKAAGRPVTAAAVFFTLLVLFLMSALCGLIIMGALAVINIGGYCAEGGPYAITSHCPKGSAVVLSAGIPLLFLLGALYAFAKPTSWPSTFGWLWPVLFIGMAIAFFIGASNDPGGIGWAAIVTGLIMLGLGIAPVVVFAGRSRDGSSPPAGGRWGAASLSQLAVLFLGVAAGVWAWGWIG